MIATGTDVKRLERLLFMRDVKSKDYFEQMKGRGTRTLDHDGLRKVSAAAKSAKTHYVIVDAIGVTKSLKTDSRPPVTRPTVPSPPSPAASPASSASLPRCKNTPSPKRWAAPPSARS